MKFNNIVKDYLTEDGLLDNTNQNIPKVEDSGGYVGVIKRLAGDVKFEEIPIEHEDATLLL